MPDRASPYTVRAALRRQAVLLVALPVLVVIIVIGALGHAPLAGVLLAAELGVLALVRAVLPVSAVGALAVRHRPIDVAVLLALAVGLLFLAGSPNL